EADAQRGQHRGARARQTAQVEGRRGSDQQPHRRRGRQDPGGPEANAQSAHLGEGLHGIGGAPGVGSGEEHRGDDEDAKGGGPPAGGGGGARPARGGAAPAAPAPPRAAFIIGLRGAQDPVRTRNRSQRLFPVGPVVTRSPVASSTVPESQRESASARIL